MKLIEVTKELPAWSRELMMDLTRIAHARFREVDTSGRVVDQREWKSVDEDKTTFLRFIQFGGGLVKIILDSEDPDIIKTAEDIMSSYNVRLMGTNETDRNAKSGYRDWDVGGKK